MAKEPGYTREAFDVLQRLGKTRRARLKAGPVLRRGEKEGLSAAAERRLRERRIIEGEQMMKMAGEPGAAPVGAPEPAAAPAGRSFRDRLASALYGASRAMTAPIGRAGEVRGVGPGLMRGVIGTSAELERGRLAKAAERKLTGAEERERRMAKFKAGLRETPEAAAERAEKIAEARQPTAIERERVRAGMSVKKAAQIRKAEDVLTKQQKGTFMDKAWGRVNADPKLRRKSYAEKQTAAMRLYYQYIDPDVEIPIP